jgi:ribosomal protein S18 acetylase RimI-like enzyme
LSARVALRRAVAADAERLLPWIVALNRHEGIDTAEADLRRALDHLLAHEELGGVWWFLAGDAGVPVGYALVTYGYDLEFAGRDAYLCELFIDPAARGRGLGHAAIDAVLAAMPALEVRALHLQVRPENVAAWKIYQRAGFADPGRTLLTKRI